ncbi:MAG: sigma-70 family RNA polymerase sigma factor [Candidatus Moranbacteria bacterium]|jgi:RNA polymerase sigma factor (sigma-70 family)|nr:sigma-70 family RNA polymerase sigma factor [Candidatus Moranbacteria bacterium]MBP9801400.1 sigma-70 family RNA polymerase sigma factor [Candidatus Moranbacteria bacterium]
MERNEKKLIEASLHDDGKAFEELLSVYLRPVYAFVLFLTRDVPMAEDVTQETSIKVWKHLARFDTEKSFKTWVFAIAKNTAYDALKKKRDLPFSLFSKGENEEEEDLWSERIVDEAPLIDELLVRAESAEVLDQKLNMLSPRFQQILRLHYREDFSLAEIAEILGEPYNTIKSRHGRAIRSLRQTFEKKSFLIASELSGIS